MISMFKTGYKRKCWFGISCTDSKQCCSMWYILVDWEVLYYYGYVYCTMHIKLPLSVPSMSGLQDLMITHSFTTKYIL